MLDSIKKIHIVGAGGVGVSAIAKLFIHQGKRVTGSDISINNFASELVSLGATICVGHARENVPKDAELLVYSPAVGIDNPERVAAAEMNIPQLSYPEALGELSKIYNTIAVSGTHGKSTTTAMVGMILEAAEYDPTVIVGSRAPTWRNGNFRAGNSEYFVVEACEHMGNMTKINPQILVITNIEADHLDYYRDLNHIRDTFQISVDKLGVGGVLVRNAESAPCMELRAKNSVEFMAEKTSFESDGASARAVAHKARFTARDRAVKDGKQSFEVYDNDKLLGAVELQIPGLYNVENALAAITATAQVGVEFSVAASALAEFAGVWRRFERVGVFNGAEIISDYAHHPTAVRNLIAATREFFPNRRIVMCFQPHQHSRTKILFNDFVNAFDGVDALILSEIYSVAGRTNDSDEISSKDIVEAIKSPIKTKIYAPDLDSTERELRKIIKEGDVILIVGAGSIDSISRKML